MVNTEIIEEIDKLGMTDEQWEQWLEYTRTHKYGEQNADGIDLSLLRANLLLTPQERLEALQEEQILFEIQPYVLSK